MKKNLIMIAFIWIVVFVLTFITAGDNLGFGARLGGSLVLTIGGWIVYWSKSGGKAKGHSQSAPVRVVAKKKELYIFRGMERKFTYRFDGKYIYEGMTAKFFYRVEGDKIYKGMDSKFAYRLDGNKIYRGMERQPLYRIDGNNVYGGDFGRQPVFRISNSISIN